MCKEVFGIFRLIPPASVCLNPPSRYIKAPSRRMLVMDRQTTPSETTNDTGISNCSQLGLRHGSNSGPNISFADGHQEMRRVSSIPAPGFCYSISDANYIWGQKCAF